MFDLIRNLIAQAGYILDPEDYKFGIFYHRDGGFLKPNGVSILLETKRNHFAIADARGGKKASEMWYNHDYKGETINDYRTIKKMLNEH